MDDVQQRLGFPPLDEQWMIYLVVNGALRGPDGRPVRMSAGKLAAQTFQACQRLLRAADRGEGSPQQRAALAEWELVGTRTLVRIAETPTMWQRCKDELDCVVLVDAGLTEIEPGSETVLACWPVQRKALPAMLRNKKVPLLRS